MRETLLLDLKDVPVDEFLLGYFEPGHSFKGKQVPLSSDDELNKMYFEHHKRRSINLWVKSKPQVGTRSKRPRCVFDLEGGPTKILGEGGSTKRSSEGGPTKRSSVYDSQLKRMDELEEILDKLKYKHKENLYTPEQFHCWANLIQMNKHTSYECPPNKPTVSVQ